MSDASPEDQKRQRLESTLDRARRELGKARNEAQFASIIDEVSRRKAKLPEHRSELERLRSRGYTWRPELEADLTTATEEVDALLGALREDSRDAERALRSRFERVERASDRIRGDVLGDEREIEELEDAVDDLEKAVDEAEKRLKAQALPFNGRVDGAAKRLKELHWTMDQFEGASFKMRPEENPVAAAEAIWEDLPGDDDGCPGLLLFTDLRVRFEQREEVVTKKKFFFFTAEKEDVQEVQLDEPVGNLMASDDSTRGMVFKDQLLTFRWSEKANAPSSTTFKLTSGSAKDWDDVVEMLMSGDINRFRVSGDASPSNAGMPVDWPRSCRGCGSAMPSPVKGQTVLVCPYCSTEHQVTLG